MVIRGCEKLQKYEYFTCIVKAITFFLGHGFDFFVWNFFLLTKNGLVFENFVKFWWRLVLKIYYNTLSISRIIKRIVKIFTDFDLKNFRLKAICPNSKFSIRGCTKSFNSGSASRWSENLNI